MVIYLFMISIVLCAFVFVVGILFRVAGALRLSVPLLYCFIVAFFMPGWSTRNPELCYGILYGLVGLVVLSWVMPSAACRLKEVPGAIPLPLQPPIRRDRHPCTTPSREEATAG